MTTPKRKTIVLIRKNENLPVGEFVTRIIDTARRLADCPEIRIHVDDWGSKEMSLVMTGHYIDKEEKFREAFSAE